MIDHAYKTRQQFILQVRKRIKYLKNSVKYLIVLIIFTSLILTYNFIGLTKIWADEIKADCDNCNFYDKTYYADFQRGSKEYWNSYCSGTLGTAWECE